jgi:hypothetical protein
MQEFFAAYPFFRMLTISNHNGHKSRHRHEGIIFFSQNGGGI